jgi:hypothetical protein
MYVEVGIAGQIDRPFNNNNIYLLQLGCYPVAVVKAINSADMSPAK